MLFSLGTQAVFARFEGRVLAFHEALLFVVESFSTTGYGELLPFRSPVTTAWSIFLIGTGFVVIFVWLSALAGTWLSARFQTLAPRRAPRRLAQHVIIAGAGPLGQFLARELRQAGVPYLLVDDRRGVLAGPLRDGLVAMEGDLRRAEGLQAAGMAGARALVCTLSDPDNAGVCLVARVLRPDLPVYCTVEHAENERFLLGAGASHVISAKRSLGERLGWLAGAPLAGQLDRLWGQVAGLSVCQVPVLPGAALLAPSLKQARVRERTGATVLGLWQHGHFVPALGSDLPIRPGQVLIAAGRPDDLERLRALGRAHARPMTPPGAETLVLGYGDVGQAAVLALQAAGIPCRVLSLGAPDHAPPGWMRGDATDGADLERAGIAAAGRCIVALDNDDRAVFATLVARQLHPAMRIVARANSVEAVDRLYLAGADNVLSVSEVAGLHLARQVAPQGTSPPALDDLAIRAVPLPGALAGRSLASGQVGRRSGCIVVAIRAADGSMDVNPAAQRALMPGEELVLFGTAAQFAQFTHVFGT